MSRSDSPPTATRRDLLKAAGATSAISLAAGCAGGDGDDGSTTDGGGSGDLGERVPPITIQFWSGHSVWDSAVPLIQRQLEEGLNHTVETRPVDVSTMVDDAYNDARNYHFATWGGPSALPLADPGYNLINGQSIELAGANGRPGEQNYANCEFTELAYAQATEGDPEERAELIAQAMEIYSHDRPQVNLLRRDQFSAIRTDAVNVQGTGNMGVFPPNAAFFANSTPVDGDTLVFGTADTGFDQRLNHVMLTAQGAAGMYQALAHSPLLIYDNNWELTEELASNYSISDDGLTVTVKLKEGATFHNGDPITAEHAKFTMEFIEENDVPTAVDQGFSSIEVVNDLTVEFNFDEPSPMFVTSFLATWGILHKPTWEDVDDLSQFDPSPGDDYVGSGPFRVTAFNVGENVRLDPHPEGHVKYGDIDHSWVLVTFDDVETLRRGTVNGEVDAAMNVSGTAASDIQAEAGEDVVQIANNAGFSVWFLPAAYPRPPVRYNEFMDAVGMSINRRDLNDVVYAGLGEPNYTSNYYTDTIELYPDDPERIHTYTDQPTGDPEGARQVLEDAGWGWDGDGNLRYPADLDVEPMWPEGEVPSPPDFPCMEDGEYVGSQ